MAKDRPDALLVPGDTFLVSQRSRIAQFAIENKLPSAYSFREHVEAGGLMAYSPNYHDLFRRAAFYVDRILKGSKPADLPVQNPTKFELVVNLKTAKALGVHSGCMGCGSEPRNDELAGAETVFMVERNMCNGVIARHCRPAGVEGHITCKGIASEPGRSRVWPSDVA